MPHGVPADCPYPRQCQAVLFWFELLRSPFRHLPVELYDQGALGAMIAKGKPFEVCAPRDYVENYSTALEHVQQ